MDIDYHGKTEALPQSRGAVHTVAGRVYLIFEFGTLRKISNIPEGVSGFLVRVFITDLTKYTKPTKYTANLYYGNTLDVYMALRTEYNIGSKRGCKKVVLFKIAPIKSLKFLEKNRNTLLFFSGIVIRYFEFRTFFTALFV